MNPEASTEEWRHSFVNLKSLLYLCSREIAELGVFDFRANVAMVERAYILLWAGDVRMPKSDYLTYHRRSTYDRIITLLGYLGGAESVSGVKVIGSSTTNHSMNLPRAAGLIILNDPDTQRPFCVLDAAQISAARTAAVTAVAICHLGPKRIHKVAMIGCGYLAETHLLMWSQLYGAILSVVHVFDKRPDASSSLRAYGETIGCEVVVEGSAEEAINNADIIITLTTEEVPYIEPVWIKEGALYAAVSLLDAKLSVYTAVDRIVVDDESSCKHEGRPLHILAQRDAIGDLKIISIGQILSEGISIRQGADERILFNPMGTVITDLVLAYTLFGRAVRLGLGTRLSL